MLTLADSKLPHLRFLGWSRPASHFVAQAILDLGVPDPDAPIYVVVPTQESARQLKEKLAILSAGKRSQGACLSPTIIPSNQLLPLAQSRLAGSLENLFCWNQVLTSHRNRGENAELFSQSEEWKEQSWIYQAQQLSELFDVLIREGLEWDDTRLIDLAHTDARWQQLLSLKQQQQERLSDLGYQSSTQEARLPYPPSATVILACVPQLSRQLQHILSRSACRVEAWIHAPATYARHFDSWGCPIETWLNLPAKRTSELAPADWQSQVCLYDDSALMAKQAVACLGVLNEKHRAALHSVALCNADPSMESSLEEALAAVHVQAHRPRGRSFLSSEWQQLLHQLSELKLKINHTHLSAESWDYYPVSIISELLGNPLLPSLLLEKGFCKYGEKEARILSLVQGRSFPTRIAGLLHDLINWENYYTRKSELTEAAHSLAASIEILCLWLGECLSSSEALVDKLLELASSSMERGDSAWAIGNDLHQGFTQSMMSICVPLKGLLAAHSMSVESCLALLELSVERLRFTPAREARASIDIMGWRDLSYSSAKSLVITAFHDSVIPARWGLEAWLTPSIRKQLGLRTDLEHAAHDAYLLRSILAPRRHSVYFFLSRMDRKKNPLSPSSLLFKLCQREHLPALVDYLFGEHEPPSFLNGYESEESDWVYRQIPNPRNIELSAENLAQARLSDFDVECPIPVNQGFSPSLLASFLSCPLRFWLQRLFKLSSQEYEWDKKQLSAMDRGNLIHASMEAFIRRYPSYAHFQEEHPHYPQLAQELEEAHSQEVETALLHEFAQFYESRYHNQSLIPLKLQYTGMQRQLASYASIQVDLWKEGWQTARDARGELLLEYKPDWVWNGFRMNVTIDRIDIRQSEDGVEMRVIDYKTGAAIKSCASEHLRVLPSDALPLCTISPELEPYYYIKGKAKKKLESYRWNNLQLPIYAAWVEQHYPDTLISAAYIRLSRKAEESALLLWGEDGSLAGLFDTDICELSSLSEHDDREQQLFSHAKQWALCCMKMIQEGRCLASAEQMGWEVERDRIFSPMHMQAPLHEIFISSSSKNAPFTD